jgi:hypothetical protein
MDSENEQPCCASWEAAHRNGTDNEMYGALVYWLDHNPYIGCDLPAVEFCPWCGARKEAKEE